MYEGALVAHSDARGEFELRTVSPGTGARLSARAAGRSPTEQVLVPGAAGTEVSIELAFESEGRALRGRVLGLGGDAIEGAAVLVGSEYEYLLRKRNDGTLACPPIGELVTTDAQGRFELAGVPNRTVDLRVRAAGHATWVGSLDANTPAWIEIRLEAGVMVRGQVQSADGQPVSGAWVPRRRDAGLREHHRRERRERSL